jgi:IS5 family transposase
MKAKPQQQELTPDLYRSQLISILNLCHELCRMSEIIDWSKFDNEFGKFFPSTTGCPATATRLIVGLFYLKHAFKLSDEELVARWIENPYWQYFCGEQYLQHKFPVHPSSLSKWRKRLEESGCELMLQEMIKVGLKTETIKKNDLKEVIVDTTVQEKAVTYPTDAKLYQRGREQLVKLAKQRGLTLRQSYTRLGKYALFKANRYFAAQQMKRGKKHVKKLKTYLGCVYRDIQRQLEHRIELKPVFAQVLQLVKRLLTQQKMDKNKLYSLHAPEVECIAKGKVNKRYEFGVKVGLVSTLKRNFVIGMQALVGNPYDGHTLKASLDQVEKLTGQRPDNGYVDLGYRGHDEEKTNILIARSAKNPKTRTLRAKLKRRNAIEPLIGHAKSDGHLDRNYLKGTLGDKMNAILSGVGYNFRVILKKLRLFWQFIFSWLWVRNNFFLTQQ